MARQTFLSMISLEILISGLMPEALASFRGGEDSVTELINKLAAA